MMRLETSEQSIRNGRLPVRVTQFDFDKYARDLSSNKVQPEFVHDDALNQPLEPWLEQYGKTVIENSWECLSFALQATAYSGFEPPIVKSLMTPERYSSTPRIQRAETGLRIHKEHFEKNPDLQWKNYAIRLQLPKTAFHRFSLDPNETDSDQTYSKISEVYEASNTTQFLALFCLNVDSIAWLRHAEVLFHQVNHELLTVRRAGMGAFVTTQKLRSVINLWFDPEKQAAEVIPYPSSLDLRLLDLGSYNALLLQNHGKTVQELKDENPAIDQTLAHLREASQAY